METLHLAQQTKRFFGRLDAPQVMCFLKEIKQIICRRILGLASF